MLDIFIICVYVAHMNLWEKYPQHFTYDLHTIYELDLIKYNCSFYVLNVTPNLVYMM